MSGTSRSVRVNATGTLDAGQGILRSVGILGGANAATAIVRRGGGSGTVIAAVGVGAGLSAQRTFVTGVAYTDLHVTVTGTTPEVEVELG